MIINASQYNHRAKERRTKMSSTITPRWMLHPTPKTSLLQGLLRVRTWTLKLSFRIDNSLISAPQTTLTVNHPLGGGGRDGGNPIIIRRPGQKQSRGQPISHQILHLLFHFWNPLPISSCHLDYKLLFHLRNPMGMGRFTEHLYLNHCVLLLIQTS